VVEEVEECELPPRHRPPHDEVQLSHASPPGAFCRSVTSRSRSSCSSWRKLAPLVLAHSFSAYFSLLLRKHTSYETRR
jgi:hypothetical protein